MPPLELYPLWFAIAAYASASAAAISGFVFTAPRLALASILLSTAGLVSHGVALGARWSRLGHGPSVGFFEVASGLVLLGVFVFVALASRISGLRVVGAAAMPAFLLILGATLLADPEARVASGALASGWLVVHVLFANLAFACYVAASVLAVGQLLSHAGEPSIRVRYWTQMLPKVDDLDTLTFRLVGAGLLLQGAMIISGAIWANDAWGRYWAWDPMETWSLIAWAVYAIYLHLTLTMGWRGRRSAWLIVTALAVILFSLLGVPIAYESIHGAYLRF